ncbi:hypothetical protein ACN47E_008879 [Coniothyrium glycines]
MKWSTLLVLSTTLPHINARNLPPRDLPAVPIYSRNNTYPESDNAPPSLRPAFGFFDDDLASAADWTTYTQKGGALMCALTSNDEAAGLLLHDKRTPPSAASIWRGDLRQEMQAWYWRDASPATFQCKLDEHWELGEAMKSLGMNGKPSSEGGDNVCYRVEHWDMHKQENGRQVPAINQWYSVAGKDYRATKAHYAFGINTQGGAIFNFFLEGPKAAASNLWYSGRKFARPGDLPQLRSLSDILWGFWNRGNPNIKNIRYFFMIGISNEATQQLIASCLHNAKKELREWPGTSFSSDSDEGHALLGSPNGAVFAYFLFQHKAELGHKTISTITILRPENDDDVGFVDPTLIFHVEDVPELNSGEENKGMMQGGEKDVGRGIVRVHKL